MKNILKDFTLDHHWPSGLPTECEHCGNTYDKRFAMQTGPGRVGRFLKMIAPWIGLVMFVLMLGLHFRPTPGHMYPVPLFVLVPPVLTYVVGAILPIKTRLYCFKCDRASYFRLSDNWATDKAGVTIHPQKTPVEPGFERWE